MPLNTPSGYSPIGMIGITTGQIKWALIQYRVNATTNELTMSFHSYDSYSRTATVRAYVSFIRTP